MNSPGVPGERSLMNIFKVVGQMIVNLFQGARRAQRTSARARKDAKDRRWQGRRGVSEAERLDRIRQPWKYQGK
jgi:hypothetical protein